MKATKTTILLFFILISACIGFTMLQAAPTTAPLVHVGVITACSIGLTFLFSLVTSDYSWTDRLWSTLPVAYAWIYASAAGFTVPSLTAMALITLWGARLTYNFARRGGYTGEEDYRWTILRQRINNPVLWLVFNLLFIAFYQQFLFIAFTSPLMLLVQSSSLTFTPLSYVAILLFALCLGIETLADQQQYTFQQAKYNLLPRTEEHEEDYERGFRTSGLFKFSRHPNYFGELGVWYAIYLFCVSFSPSLFHFSLVGPLLLTLLFIGSTIFTESITAGKYPAYKAYQQSVPPILLKFW
ncbi:DUF1295 domain-containing protein [Sphaerochaeta globosa]|uniref:Uncharacterized protein n=1 Tax=Sphaerochaeta globosa (strain ATCC BAA-1886 / DSM 22777 / Buddy) TaxID=158189 RepID=F0RVG7_SPHGB|nr:DUF1295 domain-containing protein [Sphaerochaeta globosa]ADY12959.1 protein of unknown function DUF1295 [Sphaerochaeta globosa str. Buddy]